MPVQEVIPRIRKQRTINYGNTETVNGTGKVVLFDYDGEQATPLLVTVQCTDFRWAARSETSDRTPRSRGATAAPTSKRKASIARSAVAFPSSRRPSKSRCS